jgi:hypothetical protein
MQLYLTTDEVCNYVNLKSEDSNFCFTSDFSFHRSPTEDKILQPTPSITLVSSFISQSLLFRFMASSAYVDVPSSASGEPKCLKLAGALSKTLDGGKSKLDFSLTGSKENNALIALLKCDARALKDKLPHCGDAVKRYDKCHASVMGTGMFEGRKGCAAEAEDLLRCVHQST